MCVWVSVYSIHKNLKKVAILDSHNIELKKCISKSLDTNNIIIMSNFL